MADKLRVVVADDNREWRQMISDMLPPECHVVGQVVRGNELLEWACHPPARRGYCRYRHVRRGGLKVLPEFRTALPEAILIVVSPTCAPVYMDEALRRGADAYVRKDRILSELTASIASAGERRERLTFSDLECPADSVA